MSIEDNKWSEELLDDHFGEMRLLLTDTCENFVKTDWFEKYRMCNHLRSWKMKFRGCISVSCCMMHLCRYPLMNYWNYWRSMI